MILEEVDIIIEEKRESILMNKEAYNGDTNNSISAVKLI